MCRRRLDLAPNALGGSGVARSGTFSVFFRLSSGWPFGGQVVGQNPPQKGCGRFVAQTSGHLRAPPGTPHKIKNSRLWSENSSPKKCFFLRFRAHFQKGRIFLGHIFGQPPGTSGHLRAQNQRSVRTPQNPPFARPRGVPPPSAPVCPTNGLEGVSRPHLPDEGVSRLSPGKKTQKLVSCPTPKEKPPKAGFPPVAKENNPKCLKTQRH